MNASRAWVSVCVVIGLLAGTAGAVVIATVPVGNPGNAGEWSGDNYGGYGPDRICGSVAYMYNIGKYEVTAGQYCEFLNSVAKTDTYGLYNTYMWERTPYPYDHDFGCKIERYEGSGTQADPYKYRVASNFANRPVNYVSYLDACRFANWLHNGQPTGAQGAGTTERGAYTLDGSNGDDGIQRNPGSKWAVTSEDEWYKAAYYKGGSTNAGYFDYPTSSDGISSDMANYYGFVGYTTDVGSYAYSSPYGTFDQGGNVWEWNEAMVYGSDRGLRGGSFNNDNSYIYFGYDGYLRASFRAVCDSPAYENYTIGFRVSEVPEPCSALMVVVGAFGLASGRRRG